VQSLQSDPNYYETKGAWNAEDLNRIEKNTAYCAEWMLEKKIVRVPPNITVYENDYWTKDMIPTKSEIDRILANIRMLVESSKRNPAIAPQLPNIYYGATQINYVLANQIEFALDLMHDQPKLPLEYWDVEIECGLITKVQRDDGSVEIINAQTALVAEDEIVTIMGTEYGEYAQFQNFTYWSGSAEDIGLLENYKAKQTTFKMPYRDVKLVANFETHIPRKLTITNGYISTKKDPTAESGPSSGMYLAGDEVMIIANVASSGKAFYEWTGTEEALGQIVGVTDEEDPSTAILTMPDCDVTLAPHYINAGQHSVTVTNGSGGGWYDYNEYVSISADVPSHYGFDYWSGDTSYLEDIYSSYQSFQMKDVNISFRAHYSYRYSYNDVQVINGYIKINNTNVTKASGLRQSTTYTLVPTPPDASQGIDYWQIEGYGSVSGNTFTVGDGNAIITGHYGPLRTLTITNLNNGGGTNTYKIVRNHSSGEITTNSTVGSYKFNGWYENGTRISTSNKLNVTLVDADRTIEARYDYYPTYTVTIVNRNNGGSTTTSQVLSGNTFSTSTNEEVGDYLFVRWMKDDVSYTTSRSLSFTVTGNTTVEAVYRPKETYHLTVNNGSGSGDYKERQWVTITANAPDPGASFTGWSTSGLRDISNSSSASTTVQMNRQNATCTANYSNIRKIKVTTNSGVSNHSIVQGNRVSIKANPAPSTWEFSQWVVKSGDATFANYLAESTYVYANSQDSEVEAQYKPIPYFTVTIENGYIWDGSNWVTSATLLRDSTNAIKMKPAPTGMQFFQWEVYVDGVLQTDANDVYEPLSEQTRLRKLLRNMTLKATYFVPDPEAKYTLTIERKDGSVEQNNDISVGENVTITASAPDEGMEFYKWSGDTAYIAGGIYNEESYIHMPAQNITVKENFVPEGFVPEFEVVMTDIYGKCCYVTEYEDPETGEITKTEHWVERHSFPEGARVDIKATGYDEKYYFAAWGAVKYETDEDARIIIDELSNPVTTITVPDYDVAIEAKIALKTTFLLNIIDGGTSGNYYEGKRADVYFSKENTNDVHYEFIRWTGATVSQLELYDGGMFNVLVPGTVTDPQFIKMPGQATEIKATYNTLYRLTLNGGSIDETGLTQDYFKSGTKIAITADPAPEGMKFQYWEGDTDKLTSKYDRTTTVTTATGVTTLKAVYSTDSEQNSVGYVETSLIDSTTVNNDSIIVISGTIEVGFMLTDSNGHIYIVTSVNEATGVSTIYRMTKVVQGGNIYG
jgi:hypothetical protein